MSTNNDQDQPAAPAVTPAPAQGAQSPTPRTDAFYAQRTAKGDLKYDSNSPGASHARTLERELNEANCAAMSNADAAKMAEMERDTLRQQLAAVEKQRDEWRTSANYLNGQADTFKAQLAAVTKERDEAREQWRMSSVCRELQAKLTAAESELAAVRGDRERLDWLSLDRQLDSLSVEIHGTDWPGLGPANPPVSFVKLNAKLFAGDTPRAAIDSAMKQEGRG